MNSDLQKTHTRSWAEEEPLWHRAGSGGGAGAAALPGAPATKIPRMVLLETMRLSLNHSISMKSVGNGFSAEDQSGLSGGVQVGSWKSRQPRPGGTQSGQKSAASLVMPCKQQNCDIQ